MKFRGSKRDLGMLANDGIIDSKEWFGIIGCKYRGNGGPGFGYCSL